MTRTTTRAVEPTAPPSLGACRVCGHPLAHPFLDLGMSPLANGYLRAEQLGRMEPFYPLRVFLCERCLLVQLEAFETPENIFGDYAYFSSYSDSWLKHARDYCGLVTERLRLGPDSRVIEVASNDGYLLRNFVERGIPVLGIEPAANIAEAAIADGIPTLVKFFGEATARELVAGGAAADLIVGNNVLAHVPDLTDFARGLSIALKPQGVITLEFPHLMRLLAGNQFDTIYHEHFSYFSLAAVERVCAAHALAVFDVEELPTHGGSLRVYVAHAADRSRPATRRLLDLRAAEQAAGLHRPATYHRFAERVREAKRKLLEFLIDARRQGQTVVGYGAAAKATTLLNYCGIRRDFIDYVVDRSPHKQGRFLPGVHIPIYGPERVAETRPGVLLLLAWNLKDEITETMSYVREWGARFVVPIPEVTVCS